jgi:hypothetical protein
MIRRRMLAKKNKLRPGRGSDPASTRAAGGLLLLSVCAPDVLLRLTARKRPPAYVKSTDTDLAWCERHVELQPACEKVWRAASKSHLFGSIRPWFFGGLPLTNGIDLVDTLLRGLALISTWIHANPVQRAEQRSNLTLFATTDPGRRGRRVAVPVAGRRHRAWMRRQVFLARGDGCASSARR